MPRTASPPPASSSTTLGNGKTAITLNNFAKLQSLGEDDRDDILSCISFLVGDVCEARDLLE